MPIAVTCPGCSAKMRAPDAAAGKKVPCPKCKRPIAVPAAEVSADFEVADDEPAAPPKKPAFGAGTAKPPGPVKVDVQAEIVDDAPPKLKAKAVVEDDEDDEKPRKKKRATEDEDEDQKSKKKAKAVAEDEDEDEQPKKKKKITVEDEKPRKKKRAEEDDDEDDLPKKKKKKRAGAGGTALVRNIIGLAVLLPLLGLAGYIFYDRYGKKDETAAAPKPGDPPSGPSTGAPGERPGRPRPPLPGGPNTPNSGAQPENQANLPTVEELLAKLKGKTREEVIAILGQPESEYGMEFGAGRMIYDRPIAKNSFRTNIWFVQHKVDHVQ